jgi:16S rRNA G966 N2-methylase RsmD
VTSYFATFISGAHDIVNQRLAKFANSDLRVLELHDGLVIFESTLSPNQVSEFRFLNNAYELLADLGTTKELRILDLPVNRSHGTFTIRAITEGQPTTIPPGLKEYIEQQSGASFTAHKPDEEFILLTRRDGRRLWGHGLPRAGFKTRTIEQGELRPELAHLMGLVAALDAKDTVLDPFAGYGGIVRECLQGFHVKKVIAVEQNEHLIPHLKSIKQLVALHGNARQLAHIEARSIDRVVTDPPWGEHEHMPEAELRALYRHALAQMHRVLRAKGAVVMLSAAPFIADVAGETSFDVIKEYPILVNGRKATIYRLRKLG